MYYEIKNIVSTLSIFPERYIKIQNFRDNIRKLTINKFVIIYKVDNVKNQVYILHIF